MVTAIAKSPERPMRLSILGATGSVGASTLDLVAANPDAFEIEAVTAQTQVGALAAIARRHGAKAAIVGDAALFRDLKAELSGSGIEAHAGAGALVEAASRPSDCVMASIVGVAGLEPSLAAVRQGRRVALANKECLVSAGRLFMREVARCGTELVPVDSEHSGVLQALSAHTPDMLDRIVLTASGGPFRCWSREALETVTVEAALKHPNWTMGRKITIDSATLMNKGLELIEALHLFGVRPDQLGVVVHPQSIVHALVSYKDGSTMAQMAWPDMRTPIALSLAWPRRMPAPTKRLDLAEVGSLTFEAPDEARFPALRVAKMAMAEGGAATAVLNAANEVAVEAFLAKRIRFLHIAEVVERAIESLARSGGLVEPQSVEEVLALDGQARRIAAADVERLGVV
ncbi:MAG TPA: 1-deoxy-D-xylulose-5-phosphate reductoisomerase [Hyphomicrobiaceae bacterium]|nr:1-deoxy-D-xylulose-5-phosphate reductoisomerase [Hyphomicrobiaceae bacterium]